MTKPKFTPDPAPNIDGLPLEQQIRMILDHDQRQFNRAEDWWPKNLEKRVEALEVLVPYLTGTWPMIDYSSVTFGYEVGEYAATCATSDGTDVGSAQALLTCYNIDYSESLNYIAISGAPFNGTGIGTYVFDATTNALKYSRLDCTRAGHKIVSTTGTSDQDLLALLTWTCGGGTRSLYVFDMDNAFAVVGNVSLGTNNTYICAERDADFILANTTLNDRFYLIDKTAGLTTITCPSGWTPVQAAATSSTGYTLLMENGGTFGFSIYTSGSISTPTITLGTIGGSTPETCRPRPIVVGSSIYWLFTVVEDQKAYLVETNFAGTQQSAVPMFDTNNYHNTRTGYDQIQYRASNDSIYYTYQDVLWRYSLTTQTYYTCTAPIDALFTPITDGRSSSFVRVGDYHWGAIINYDVPNKWGYEKIASSF